MKKYFVLLLLLPTIINDWIPLNLTSFKTHMIFGFFSVCLFVIVFLEYTSKRTKTSSPVQTSYLIYRSTQAHLRTSCWILQTGCHKGYQTWKIRKELIIFYFILLLNCHHHLLSWSKEVLNRSTIKTISSSPCLFLSSHPFLTISNWAQGFTHTRLPSAWPLIFLLPQFLL